MTLLVNDRQTTRASLYVPRSGPLFIDADMADDEALSGAVTVKALGQAIAGTVVPTAAGTFGLQRRARIVGGAGGWSHLVAPKPYANDGGVSAREIADEVAAAVGERIGAFAPLRQRLGAHFVREAGPASVALEAAAGGARWWVGYDGLTHVGERATAQAAAGSYEVLSYDPRRGEAIMALDSLAAVGVGSVLTERLDSAITVAAFELRFDRDEARMIAWCPSADAAVSEGADLLASIIARVAGRLLLGRYRYRVVQMQGTRVDVQPVRADSGLPTLQRVEQWPGIAGSHAKLTKGAEVLVEFEAGQRDLPMITGYAGREGVGHVPTEQELGGPGGAEVARKGDTVDVLMPPMAFTGTVGGLPAAGVLSAVTGRTVGTITTGSLKGVKSA